MFHKSDYYLKPEEVEHYAHEVKACGPSSQATDDVNTDSAISFTSFFTSTSNFSTLVVDLPASVADLLTSIIDYSSVDNTPCADYVENLNTFLNSFDQEHVEKRHEDSEFDMGKRISG